MKLTARAKLMDSNDVNGYRVQHLALRGSHSVYIRRTTSGRLITVLHRKRRNDLPFSSDPVSQALGYCPSSPSLHHPCFR
jgi:hypothetical protein